MPWLANKTVASAAAFDSGLPTASQTFAAAAAAWAAFWSEGAFVDLASSTNDPDAWELERRVILSRCVATLEAQWSICPRGDQDL